MGRERKGGKNRGREGGKKSSKAGAVCTRLLGNDALAPPTSVGDCDVARGTSRLLLALKVNRTARPSPGDRVDAGPWATARPRTNQATARAGAAAQRRLAAVQTGVSALAPARLPQSNPEVILQDPSPPSLVRGST